MRRPQYLRPGRGRRLVAHVCSPLAGLQACAAPARFARSLSLLGSLAGCTEACREASRARQLALPHRQHAAAGFPPSTLHPAASSGNPPGPSRHQVGYWYPACACNTNTVLQYPSWWHSGSQPGIPQNHVSLAMYQCATRSRVCWMNSGCAAALDSVCCC